LILVLKRWMVGLTVVSVNSTLYVAHGWLSKYRVLSWWSTPAALWLCMTVVTLLGTLWAWRRQVSLLTEAKADEPAPVGSAVSVNGAAAFSAPAAGAIQSATTSFTTDGGPTAALRTEAPAVSSPFAPGPAPAPTPTPKVTVAATPTRFEAPARAEVVTLAVLSVAALGAAAYWRPPSLARIDLWSCTLLTFVCGLWAATLYLAYVLGVVARRRDPRPGLTGEGVLLGAMLLACVALTGPAAGKTATLGSTGSHGDDGAIEVAKAGTTVQGERSIRFGKVVWQFVPREPSWIASSPAVDQDSVYVGVVHNNAFEGNKGAVYCLDRATGKMRWMFNNGGSMVEVFSSPRVVEGKVYVGEGFHLNSQCRLYCLGAKDGKKLWEFQTASHTESSPCVAGGKVYCGAGDDGLYCLDAATGKEVWHKSGFHVDANPLVADGRVYCGSGVGDVYKETVFFCLNADTGKELWRRPTDLPVWGEAAAADGHVYVGIGNGNFIDSDPKPAGAVLCLKAATGKRVWRADARDGVHVKVVVDSHHVYFASRDQKCYCVDRRDGQKVWERDLGSPIVASPALARCGVCGGSTSLFVATSAGRVSCLDPDTGREFWSFDVGKATGQMEVEVCSSPLVEVRAEGQGERRYLFLGTGLNFFSSGILFCLEDTLTHVDGK
jgi:outer membrane protein assembly factor BamB